MVFFNGTNKHPYKTLWRTNFTFYLIPQYQHLFVRFILVNLFYSTFFYLTIFLVLYVFLLVYLLCSVLSCSNFFLLVLHYFILSLSEVIQFTRTWLFHIIRFLFATLMCNSNNETVMLCFGVFCFVFLCVFFVRVDFVIKNNESNSGRYYRSHDFIWALSVLLLAEAETVAIVTSVSKTFWLGTTKKLSLMVWETLTWKSNVTNLRNEGLDLFINTSCRHRFADRDDALTVA